MTDWRDSVYGDNNEHEPTDRFMQQPPIPGTGEKTTDNFLDEQDGEDDFIIRIDTDKLLNQAVNASIGAFIGTAVSRYVFEDK
jgi:hypothetical protein